MDKIIVLDKGTISEVGTYEELISFNGAFAEFIRTYLTQTPEEDDEDSDGKRMYQELCEYVTEYSFSWG